MEKDIKTQALAKFLGCDVDDIETTETEHRYSTAEGEEYDVLTDTQADNIYSDRFDDFVDECIICDIPDHLRIYFDRELYKKDTLISETRGHLLSIDNGENEQNHNGETFYIYLVA